MPPLTLSAGLLALLAAPLVDGASISRKPLSTVDPGTLFTTVKRSGKGAPGPVFGSKVSAPIPTNAWWQNLVLASTTSLMEANIFQMPYVVMATTNGLEAMQPFMTLTPGQQSFDSEMSSLTLGTKESGLPGPVAASWDELSLTVAWGSPGAAGLRVPLVRGSPYVTAEYQQSTPRLSSRQMLPSLGGQKPNITVDGRNVSCDGATAYGGSTFSVQFIQSDATWLIFSPPGAEWVCQGNPFSLTAQAPLTGVVRAAIANNCTTGTGAHYCADAKQGRDASAYTELLKQHAGSYPTGATLDFAVEGDVGTVTWNWKVATMEGFPSAPLLQLAWAVHRPLLSPELRASSAQLPPTPFRDLRGVATAVVADSWTLTYKLFPDVGFAAPRPIAANLRTQLLDALKGTGGALWNGSMPDRDFDLPRNFQTGAGDTYFSGKMLARLARIVAIADELGESKEPYFADLVQRLAKRVEVWLGKATSHNPLMYDSSWGGVVACGCNYDDCGGHCEPHCSNPTSPPEGCPAMMDSGMNFGNGFYNDHHFHYGYFVYAAAVLAKNSPSWELKWREPLLAIVRDYGNPSNEDASFPLARHKDWFLGFSWAGGIPQAFVNGRNQESTSESINSYYALYTYGAAVDAPFARDLKDFGRLLTAMEVHGADTYWHVRAEADIYPGFQHGVVGVLWEHMAMFQTWFGTTPYIVYGIQALPYTPVMESFLRMDWVGERFADYQKACLGDGGCASQGWSWPMCLMQALVDQQGALKCLSALPKDAFNPSGAAANGNSLLNSLHWVATRAPPLPGAPEVAEESEFVSVLV